jgi:hypothetical protein
MGDATGKIVFINTADYVSDVTGTKAAGCMANLTTDEGKIVVVYTQSLRLQQTLEMSFVARCRVTVDYSDKPVVTEQRGPMISNTHAEFDAGFDGPFRLQSMWTLE